MFKMLLATGVLLGSFGASAALPPNWDQANKFKTILSSPDVINNLRAGLVKAITQTGDLVFAVEFDKYRCTYLITLERVPQNMPGPAQYTVSKISQPTCERP